MSSRGPGGRLAAEDVLAAGRLLAGLPAFRWRRTSVARARATVQARLRTRAADFLSLVRATVFEQAGSPYAALLENAGCELGDLTTLVEQEGLEGALGQLYRRGVYLTIEEFKGRSPVVRGGMRLEVDPAGFRNPLSSAHVAFHSSGSRGPQTSVGLDLEFVWDHAADTAVFLDARGAMGWRHALWGVPGGFALRSLLRLAAAGARPARWFSQVDPAAPSLHPRYRWSARALRWGGLAVGIPLPSPIHAPFERPRPVLEWMSATLRAGTVPHLFTFPSSAVRLCEAAAEAGVAIRGAQFWLTGEPMTARCVRVIEAAGGQATGNYGSSECGGTIAYGCLAGERRLDLHLLDDFLALIQPGDAGRGPGDLPPGALLFSSLRATAPFVLLNLAIGDQALVSQATCGCPLEHAGWRTVLRHVRSYAKLTAGGMNFLDADVVRVLEDVLPERFGGDRTDYQVVEEEDPGGRPVISLLVHPRLGPRDADAVREAFLAGIGGGDGAERVMELLWRSADVLRVERRAPAATSTGKIRHSQIGRRPAPAQPTREPV